VAIMGQKKALIVDDDPTVLGLMQTILARLGWSAEIAKDGGEAMQKYSQATLHNEPFQIVFLDLKMPGGIEGKDTVNHLLDFDSRAYIIVMSGYQDDPLVKKYYEYGFKAGLGKPFTLSQLHDLLISIEKELGL
jgi:CheY-like chemotaxis protein